MAASPTYRIVVLGKTGAGKSSLGNTLFGKTTFQISHSSSCQAESKLINGRHITWIDTPGFFDTSRSEKDMKSKILQCIVECAPGPHAFILVLKVEKFTEHEQAVIQKIFQYFSQEVLRYAVILFTHGDQLPEEMTIEEFVSQSECLVELVQKCGGRCHVIDNKYWNNKPKNEYRSNKFQVEQLLKTIDKIVMENKGGYYSNELLEAVEAEIQKEEERIRQTSGALSPKEAREEAKSTVYKHYMVKFACIVGKGLLLAARLGGSEIAGLILLGIKGVGAIKQAVGKKRRAKPASIERASTKGSSAEKGASKAKTAADVFSKLAKIFRTTNADMEEVEVSPSFIDEAATLEEDEDDDDDYDDDDDDDNEETEEIPEGAQTEEIETTDVLPSTETEVAAGEEEEEPSKKAAEEETTEEAAEEETSEEAAEEETSEEAAEEETSEEAVEEETSEEAAEEETSEEAAEEETSEEAVEEETSEEAAEGTADVTSVKDGVGGAALGEKGTAALTTAAEEEIDGALLSAAEGAAELSVKDVEMEAVKGATGVVAETVAQVVDVVATVAENCCIQ